MLENCNSYCLLGILFDPVVCLEDDDKSNEILVLYYNIRKLKLLDTTL